MKYRISGNQKIWFSELDGGKLTACATDCELQLWSERSRMISALKAANSWICNIPATTDQMRKEKFSVISEIEAVLTKAENPSPAQNSPQTPKACQEVV